MAGADDPGAEFEAAPGSGRAPTEPTQPALSVADLLARHGLDPRAARPGPAKRHRLREPDDGDRWASPADEPSAHTGGPTSSGDREDPSGERAGRGGHPTEPDRGPGWFDPPGAWGHRDDPELTGELPPVRRPASAAAGSRDAPARAPSTPSDTPAHGAAAGDFPSDVAPRPATPPVAPRPRTWPEGRQHHEDEPASQPDRVEQAGGANADDGHGAGPTEEHGRSSERAGADVADRARHGHSAQRTGPGQSRHRAEPTGWDLSEDPLEPGDAACRAGQRDQHAHARDDDQGPDQSLDQDAARGPYPDEDQHEDRDEDRDEDQDEDRDQDRHGDQHEDRDQDRHGDQHEDRDQDRHGDERGFELRAKRIDESLTRLTAIHAGLGIELTERLAGPGADHGDAADPDLPPAPRHPRWTRAGRLIGLVAAVALFVGSAAGWGIQTWLDGKLRTVAALDANTGTLLDLAARTGDQNYLLAATSTAAPSTSGPDSTGTASPGAASSSAGPTGPSRVGADAAGVSGTGTDASPALVSVLLVHVPAKADRMVLTSFPANLAIDRPSCDRWDGTGYPGGTTPAQPRVPLAATYAVGGPRCLTKTVQRLTGLSVNHYAGLDLAGLAPMVEAVHGVPLCLPGAGSPGAPALGAAPSTLNGAEAVDFLGAAGPTAATTAGSVDDRLAPALDTDDATAWRPQLLLTALLRKATSDQVLAHLGELRGLVSAFADHSLADHAGLGDFAALAQSLRRTDPSRVLLTSVPTAGASDAHGSQALAGELAKALFDAIRADTPLPGQQSAGAADDATPRAGDSGHPGAAPSTVTLSVRNGSSRAGLANHVADSLRTLGFTIASVGDASPSPGRRTVVRHSADQSDQAAAVAAAVPSAASETVPGANRLLELVLGDDFDGQVQAAPAAVGQDSGPRTLRALTGTCR